MYENGNYVRIDKRGKEVVNSQLIFCEEAKKYSPKEEITDNGRVFIPAESM